VRSHQCDHPRRQAALLGEPPVHVDHVAQHPGVLPGRDAEAVELGLGPRERVEHLGLGVFRDQALDEVGRPLVEGAARATVRVPLDPAIRRVGGFGGDPSPLEGEAVDPGAMAVAVGQERGAVGDDPVEVLGAWRPAREVVQRPATAGDPFGIGPPPGVLLDRRQVGVEPPILVQRAAQRLEPGLHRMDVRVLEPR